MSLCNSCCHAQVKYRKGNHDVFCTSKQNTKNHNKYCHDYLNKERFIKPHEMKQTEFERYKELG